MLNKRTKSDWIIFMNYGFLKVFVSGQSVIFNPDIHSTEFLVWGHRSTFKLAFYK